MCTFWPDSKFLHRSSSTFPCVLGELRTREREFIPFIFPLMSRQSQRMYTMPERPKVIFINAMDFFCHSPIFLSMFNMFESFERDYCEEETYYELFSIEEFLEEEDPNYILEKVNVVSDKKKFESLDLQAKGEKKTKPSIEEPPELKLKPLPNYLKREGVIEYVKMPQEGDRMDLVDIQGISSSYWMHKIRLEEGQEGGDERGEWVSPVHCVLKKNGMTIMKNEKNVLIPTGIITGWRICMDYCKLSATTKKDHFPLPFIDQMFDRLTGKEFYCFMDGYFGYNHNYTRRSAQDDVYMTLCRGYARSKKNKVIHPIYYESKTLDEAQENYTTIKKELLVIPHGKEGRQTAIDQMDAIALRI
ncbi:uncharacterized protein E5676_scaffold236G00330 [Cucumis melo var. makuwa]|uniref:RNA-directed DNA polymerase-like protein n=1 Tax=Cucumis melo var. makuwa TaxID=1194695 RepID=A0A5D3DV59_CUCMM|nr:uncharacterized protein E6C27_scaffold61G002390 [Cucumis melo var. makuwa]TYK27180.1 uncharacterized protein E5676_scaffold236G00330 [Cucumis melo var. makuwa]